MFFIFFSDQRNFHREYNRKWMANYRQRIKQDPVRYSEMKAKDRERRKRLKEKRTAMMEHFKISNDFNNT